MKNYLKILFLVSTLLLTSCQGDDEYEEEVILTPLPSVPFPPPMAQPPAFAIPEEPEEPEEEPPPPAHIFGSWGNNVWSCNVFDLQFTLPQGWASHEIDLVDMFAMHEEDGTGAQIVIEPIDHPDMLAFEYVQYLAEMLEDLGQDVIINAEEPAYIAGFYWYSYSTSVDVADILRLYSRHFVTIAHEYILVITITYTEDSPSVEEILGHFAEIGGNEND